MSVPTNLKYSKSHEWVKPEADGTVTVGITHHAQELLGDMVFVELPEIGQSVKAAADVYSPISGEVIAVNSPLADEPGKINEDAFSAWLFKLKPSNTSELDGLLDAAAYTELVENEEH